MTNVPSAVVTFDEIERELGAGMVPKIFRILESHPALLAHVWGEFKVVVIDGVLPRVLKEMVGTVVATTARCEYVRTVHLHSLSLQGVSPVALEAVRNGDYAHETLSDATRNALRYAAIAASARSACGSPDPSDVDRLRAEAGEVLGSIPFDDAERLELVATVALFEQVCAVATLAGLDPREP